MMRFVLVTGVSSGIGYGVAQSLVQRGIHVFGSVRNQADAQKLRTDLGPNFTPLLFDVTDEAAIANAKHLVTEKTKNYGLDALINNAGIAFGAPILHVPIQEFAHHIDVNVLGTLRVTQAFSALLMGNALGHKKPGRIINISSISGRITRPFMGAYSASKYALEAMSDALRRELIMYNIKVVIVEPGMVKTKIWSKAKMEKPQFQDTDYAPMMQNLNREIGRIEKGAIPVSRVVKTINKALLSPNPKTRYLVTANHLIVWLSINILGDRIVDKIFHRRSAKLAKI